MQSDSYSAPAIGPKRWNEMVSGHVIKLVDQKSGNWISEEVALKWLSQEKGPEECERQPQETEEITIPSSSEPGELYPEELKTKTV